MKTLQPNNALALAERLCRDYAALAGQLRELTRFAEAGDLRACDAQWDAFAHALEAHYAFAEGELFPQYLASSTGSAALVLRALATHSEARRQLLCFGVELQLNLLRPRALQAFLEGVREQTGREVRTLCAWAESLPEGGRLRSLLARASEVGRRAA
jgi:hypothetical protein